MNKSGFVIVDKGAHSVGINDKDGREVLPCVYDKVLDYDDDGYVRFIKGGVYGTIDFHGNIVIPLTAGITHLGVFHNGTARAQKNNDKWGLVDEQGNEVGDFSYKQINAHYGNGYKAYLMDNTVGFLSEDGTFTSHNKKEQPKPRYRRIATYRYDIAPACLWKGGWVFIDREENRINDLTYWSMDPVLRQGVYYVAKGPNQYGAARYDGTPIVDEWFTHPLRFDENGFSPCQQLYHDENGKEVREHGGQPRYNYGILRTDGSFLFPMVYSSLHWNNYTTRDCWFAEDDTACFLLFQDGSRRIYRKNSAMRGGGLPYIPSSEYDNDIPEETYMRIYHPEEILTKHYYRFHEVLFCHNLGTLRWFGVQYDNTLSIFHFTPLRFFYRDTDATIDLSFYKVGRLLRAGYFMDSANKLGRPIHKTRFVIATSLDLSKADFLERYIRMDALPFKGNAIHCNACFLVTDVCTNCGVTQILLLQIPYAAILLASKYRFNFKRLAQSDFFAPLKASARRDLQQSMSLPVHGYSLSSYWQEAMHHPIGMNRNMHPVHLKLQHNYHYLTDSPDEKLFYYHYDKILHGEDRHWTGHVYHNLQRNVIKLVVGNISKLFVDAIVTTDEPSLLGGRVGKSVKMEASNMPCSWVIHTIGPTWQRGLHSEAKILKSCYTTALKLAGKEKLHSIAFPCFLATGDYDKKQVAQIAILAILQSLKKRVFEGDVAICCTNDDEAQIYKDTIEHLHPRHFTFPCL